MPLINSRPRILAASVIAAVLMTFLACLISQIIFYGLPSADWLLSQDAFFLLGFSAMYGSLGGLLFGVLAFWVNESERFGFLLCGILTTAALLATLLFQWLEGMASV